MGPEWDYVTVPEPEDDTEGESKGVKYECKLCKHKLWLYSYLLKRTQDLQQLGNVQPWMEEEEVEEEEMGQEGPAARGMSGSQAMRTMQSRSWGTACCNC
eukprot:1160928-Pelagomonas_calceolata.AAC.4